VAGGAVTGAGTGSTAVAVAVAGEIWISDREANSETAEEAEYDDAVEAGAPEAGSTISKDSSNVGETETAFDVFCVGAIEGKLRFGLAGRAG